MNDNYGMRFKKHMQERGIKQSYLSKKTGLSQNTVSRILRGVRGISAEEFIKICVTLEIDPNAFKNPHKEAEDERK